MRRIIAASMTLGMAFVLLAAQGAAQDARAASAAVLDDLTQQAGSETLVTLILRERGVEVPNLLVSEVYPTHVVVRTQQGEISSFRTSDIAQVQVQTGAVQEPEEGFVMPQVLTDREQQTVNSAVLRAVEIFGASDTDQTLKMQAAALMMLGSDETVAKQGQTYLEELLAANDVAIQLTARLFLYYGGDTSPASELIALGLTSGNRRARAYAANLAGLLADQTQEETLLRLVDDSDENISSAAAVALAQLGNTDCIPTLIEMLTSRNAVKAEAAVTALSMLGGETVIEQLKYQADKVSEAARFRIGKVLYRLDDPMGDRILRETMQEFPTLTLDAAVVLAKDGDTTAIQRLRQRLESRYDATPEMVDRRARAATAILLGGNRQMLSELQTLLRVEDPEARVQVCDEIAKTGLPYLLTLTQSAIGDPDPRVALAACRATVALASEDFHKRLARIMS